MMLDIYRSAARLIESARGLHESDALPHDYVQERCINSLHVAQMSDQKWLFNMLYTPDSPCVLMNRDYSDPVLYADTQDREDCQLQMVVRSAFECRFCYEGVVSLHAACVENGEYAIAFTGNSGMGKSTRAKAWADALDFAWISGDRPAIRLEKNGSTACGVPWDGKEQIFRDVERPLMAILDVRRSSTNYVRRLTPQQARKVLVRQVFIPMWDTDAAVMAMTNIRMLIAKTPVYRVFCGPSEADAKEIYDILFRHPEKIGKEDEEMKIRDGFVLRNIVDEYIVMPTGDNIAKFSGSVVMNEVSAFVFEQLKNPVTQEDLLAAVLAEFDVDEETARQDLVELLREFRELKLIED